VNSNIFDCTVLLWFVWLL